MCVQVEMYQLMCLQEQAGKVSECHKRACTESWLKKIYPLLHQGFEPAPVVCQIQCPPLPTPPPTPTPRLPEPPCLMKLLLREERSVALISLAAECPQFPFSLLQMGCLWSAWRKCLQAVRLKACRQLMMAWERTTLSSSPVSRARGCSKHPSLKENLR